MSEPLPPVTRVAAPPSPSPLVVARLGLVPYADALHEQRRLQAARITGAIPDTLLLLEHPPVYTLGRNSAAHHMLYAEDFLRAQGATVEHNERGGEVTFHGPGQLVAYPIILLREDERSLSDLVWRLEEVVIRTLATFGITARREPGERGVWVGVRKIASLGLSVRRWVVMHGVALNVDPDLRYFSYINPCGHAGLAMTSIRLETGANPGIERACDVFTHHFAMVFARQPETTRGAAMAKQEERV
jgi:lipoate-protein ligase B